MKINMPEKALALQAKLPPLVWVIAACVAVVMPAMLTYNPPPLATFFNQIAALIGWAGWLLLLALPRLSLGWPWRDGLISLLTALALMGSMVLLSPWLQGLPWSLALSALAILLAATLLVVTAAALARHGQIIPVFHALCVAMLIAGVLSVIVGMVQIFAPQWADNSLLAKTSFSGRAVGNLRQPNHLSSLLLWSLVALVWLTERQHIKVRIAVFLGTLLVAGIALSASRTGMLGVVMLALWGLTDRRMSRSGRVSLVLAPLVLLLIWVGIVTWSDHGQHFFSGETQFKRTDISSLRFAIWSNTLSLIAQHPWFGIGWGEFNFAWTLTPFPNRPIAFFDHAHNLVLQLMVELGIPIAVIILLLLGWSLWRAYLAGRDATDRALQTTLRCAFLLIAVMALHSQLEYPLWYAHFLLPTAFVFGLCLGGAPSVAEVSVSKRQKGTHVLTLTAVFMLLGSVAALYGYVRVMSIYMPARNIERLQQKIARGQRSWLFGHHADYVAVTLAIQKPLMPVAFQRASHFFLDKSFLLAWARAFNAAGDTEKALYLARRLKEFGLPEAQAFFAVCDRPVPPQQKRPKRCLPPRSVLSYQDFR